MDGSFNLRGLQCVELFFYPRKRQPHERIEKIMQIVACRHAAGHADEYLVSHARWQIGLRDEMERQSAMIAQVQPYRRCIACLAPVPYVLSYRHNGRLERRQPWLSPVDPIEEMGNPASVIVHKQVPLTVRIPCFSVAGRRRALHFHGERMPGPCPDALCFSSPLILCRMAMSNVIKRLSMPAFRHHSKVR